MSPDFHRPIGVLVLTLNSSLGGTEKSVLALFSGIDRSRFTPCIVTLVGDGSLNRLAREKGMETVHLGMRGPLDVRVVTRLIEVIRARNISILHTFLYHTNILGRILGWAMGIPVIVCSARSTDDWRTVLHVSLDRWTQGLVTTYLANCQGVARRLLEVERVAANKVEVLLTSIERPSQATPSSNLQLRRELAIPGDSVVVGTVANLRLPKGHAYLLEAAKRILKEEPNIIFVWVGDGDERKSLEKIIAKNKLSEKFRLVGFQANTTPFYGLFDFFVLPSLWEGLPLAIMEAMQWGLPIIATRVGGIPEIVEDKQDCRLVPPADVDALESALLDFLRNPKTARHLGNAARKRFEAANSFEAYVRQMEEIYEYHMKRHSK